MAWRVAESLEQLRRQLNAAFPKRSKVSDGGIGDAAHASRDSDHNPWFKDKKGIGIVSARDFTHDPDGGVDCRWLAKKLVESRDPRIKYIIWNGQILSSKQQPWKWRKYSGKNPHRHHLHLSVNSDSHLFDNANDWDLDIAKAQPFADLQSDEIKLEIPKLKAAGNVSHNSAAISEPMSVIPGADESNGSQATDGAVSTPQIAENITNVNNGDSAPKPEEVLPGTTPLDDSQQVSSAKNASRVYTVLGAIGGVIATVKGFLSDNALLIAIGIVCATCLFLAMIFRGVILDWLRMQLFSDPKKYNVK